MAPYGSDKPDLRFDLPLTDLHATLGPMSQTGLPFVDAMLAAKTLGHREFVKALRVPAELASQLSRAERDKLEEFAKGFGARGLARCKSGPQGEGAQTPRRSS